MSDLTVVCVLKFGGVYTPEWVEKLYHGVLLNTSRRFRFVCMTDMQFESPGIEILPLTYWWKGWWSKIEIFCPNLFSGRVLYLDLDVLVTGPIEDLLTNSGFTMCRDFLRPSDRNSSVMAFEGGEMTFLFDKFRTRSDSIINLYDLRRPTGKIGDQGYIQDTVIEAGVPLLTFPDPLVVSYKKSAKNGPPSRASVVAFHGRPKMKDAGGWAAEIWEDL